MACSACVAGRSCTSAEALPTILLGIATFFVLTDRPEQARFLTQPERDWLTRTLAAERQAKDAVRVFNLWQALYNPKVLLLSLNYIGIVTASLGVLIFVPQIIKSLGHFSNMTVGWLTMIPYICGTIAMLAWGRLSDRHARAALASSGRLLPSRRSGC